MTVLSDLSEASPSLNYSVIFPFEDNFDPEEKREWMLEHRHETIYYVGVYVVLILAGKFYMNGRPRLEFRAGVVTWNTFLAAFSFMGLCRTLPELLYVLSKHGFAYSVCHPSFIAQDRVTAFWTWMFTLSKLPEFGDTVLIVLRKHQLLFLHWFHHILALVYFWYAYSEHAAPIRWLMVMNYFAHSLMYAYYALRAMNVHLPKYAAVTITSVQIIQLIMGIYVSCFGYVRLLRGEYCQFPEYIVMGTMFLYGSVLVLFIRFFYDAYIKPKEKKVKSE